MQVLLYTLALMQVYMYVSKIYSCFQYKHQHKYTCEYVVLISDLDFYETPNKKNYIKYGNAVSKECSTKIDSTTKLMGTLK